MHLLLIAWGMSAGMMPSTQAAPPPNIVLFLADDLGYGELGCYGNHGAITPNLDRFAGEGMLLTDCHSASSVCSPSRSSLLTGRMPYRNGVFTWIPEGSPIHLRTTERSLPTLLKAAGYETCHVGKWHLNGRFNMDDQPQPHHHGYDWWLATQNNAAPSHAFPENLVRNGRPIGKADDFSAPFVVREAVTWLETRHDRTKPFFLAVWTHEPHYPIASAERYERQHARVADPEERTYRANVTQLDDAFGSLMQSLDRLGVRDSTLVFFTSDNGPEGAGDKGPGRGLAGPLRGRKRSMYEGGHRVPGLIRWPGRVEAGSRSDQPVIGSDFFPTALRAAGVAIPDDRPIDGVDIFGPVGERAAPMYWRWGGFVAYREGPGSSSRTNHSPRPSSTTSRPIAPSRTTLRRGRPSGARRCSPGSRCSRPKSRRRGPTGGGATTSPRSGRAGVRTPRDRGSPPPRRDVAGDAVGAAAAADGFLRG
jgi:arylsulfatase A